MITTFYIIKRILIYFYSLGFSLDTRPHKRQRFNHHRIEIKVVVLYCIVLKAELPGYLLLLHVGLGKVQSSELSAFDVSGCCFNNYKIIFFAFFCTKIHCLTTTSYKNSGDTSPSWGIINLPLISHTAAPLPPPPPSSPYQCC